MSASRFDITVFGATGFTGKYVCEEIVRSLNSFGPDFTWAIASRKREGLDKIREECRAWGCAESRLPGIIVADTGNGKSLVDMCLRTKCLLSAVGPYAFLGEPVIKAIISASEKLRAQGQDGVDYADLCGEPNWIEKMVLNYHEQATKLGITIVHAAGFDSIPADLGVLEAKKRLIASSSRERIHPTSIEMFFAMHANAKAGFGIHYATYQAAVNGFATRKQLGKQRKELYGKFLTGKAKPKAIESGFGAGFPKRRSYLGGAIVYDEVQNSWLLPFFFADPAIIRLTQGLDLKLGTGVEPVIFRAHIEIPTLRILLLTLFALSIFAFLSDRAWGRSFLLKHPKLCSFGLVSHDGPSQAQLDATSFTTTLVARGHSETILKNGGPGSRMGPDARITVKVRGPEVGYVTTPIVFVAAARVILQERKKLRHGTLTPGVAFAETSLVEQLNKDGRVQFSTA